MPCLISLGLQDAELDDVVVPACASVEWSANVAGEHKSSAEVVFESAVFIVAEFPSSHTQTRRGRSLLALALMSFLPCGPVRRA
eukprot:3742808-Amphidinium_carterae.1